MLLYKTYFLFTQIQDPGTELEFINVFQTYKNLNTEMSSVLSGEVFPILDKVKSTH